MPWPNFDGDILPGDLYELYEAGNFNDVPILAGTTSDDGAFLVLFQNPTPKSFAEDIRKGTGDVADIFLTAYPHDKPAAALRSKKNLMGDLLFRWSTWTWARLQSQKGQGKAYLYYFDEPHGEAGHGSDVRYVFGRPPASALSLFTSVNSKDKELSRVMVEYWTNFAKTGDPNGEGLPAWSPFTVNDPKVMVLDYTPTMNLVPDQKQLEAVDELFRYRREQSTSPP